jgi:hypothetical protein
MENVLIAVEMLQISDGEKTVRRISRLSTDDLGLFHVTNLEPGSYLVRAAGRNGGTISHVGATPTRDGVWEAFSPVYFGGASDILSATPIGVSDGSQLRADFRLEVKPALRIRGKLAGLAPSRPIDFELLRGDEQAEPSRVFLNTTTGEFEILDVTPGAFKLRATQGNKRGEVSVNVANEDVEGIAIALSPTVTIKGAMHSVDTGIPPPPIPELMEIVGRYPVPCEVNLHQRWHRGASFMSGLSPEDGQFSIENVFPGEYRVDIQCNSGYLRSATYGSSDLMTNPVITILAGSVPPLLDIRYSLGGGILAVKSATHTPP